MRCLNHACTAFVLVSVFAATARADDPPAAPAPASTETSSPMEAPAPAAPAVPAPRKFAGARTSYYMSGSVSNSPFWTVGTTRAPGYSLAAGLSFNYDGNGLAIPGSTTRSTDKLSVQALIYGSYYIYNRFPVGIAAEVALVSPLSPTAFDPAVVIQPGMVIYYAPFPAPVVIGGALSMSINVPKADGAKVSVQTLTPGLRIIYVFP
jgi:hypothetical protein